MSRLTPFQLNLNATPEQVGSAIFSAMVAAAWANFNARSLQDVLIPTLPSKAELLHRAQLAFDDVLLTLNPDNPFRLELERYVREVVPLKLDGNGPRIKVVR